MNENYIALIPAYKPGPFLLELAQKLWETGFSVVMVDDGSGTQYENLFFKCSRYAELLHHSQNSGKGRGLKTGHPILPVAPIQTQSWSPWMRTVNTA